MTLPHPLPDELADLIARRFRVLGEPMRIRLLDRLREGEANVNELTEALGASQQNVSKHLAVLAEAGILGRRKAGTHVYYRIVDEGVFALCEQVCSSSSSSGALGSSKGEQLMGCAAARTPPLRARRFADAADVILALLANPSFLLLAAFVALSRWLFVAVGACPASLLHERLAGIDRRCRP